MINKKQTYIFLLFLLYLAYVLSEVSLFVWHIISEQIDISGIYYVYILEEIGILLFLVGFYALITKKGLLNAYFWKALFIGMVTIEIIEFLRGISLSGFAPMLELLTIWWVPFLLLIALSGYVANFYYAFKRNTIWNKSV